MDEVKTLREAQSLWEHDASREMNGARNLVYRTYAIMARYVADQMERELMQAPQTDGTVEAYSYYTGWNEAITAVHATLAEVEYAAAILNRVAALRKPVP